MKIEQLEKRLYALYSMVEGISNLSRQGQSSLLRVVEHELYLLQLATVELADKLQNEPR